MNPQPYLDAKQLNDHETLVTLSDVASGFYDFVRAKGVASSTLAEGIVARRWHTDGDGKTVFKDWFANEFRAGMPFAEVNELIKEWVNSPSCTAMKITENL